MHRFHAHRFAHHVHRMTRDYDIGRGLRYASQMALTWALVMLLIRDHVH